VLGRNEKSVNGRAWGRRRHPGICQKRGAAQRDAGAERTAKPQPEPSPARSATARRGSTTATNSMPFSSWEPSAG